MNKIIKNYDSGKPDVLIFGEIHTERKHQEEQAKYIRKCNPEYVLLEVLNDRTPEDTKHVVELYKLPTIKKLLNHTALTIEGITSDDLRKMNDELNEDIYRVICANNPDTKLSERMITDIKKRGVVPSTQEELLKTPIYEFNRALLGSLYIRVFEGILNYDKTNTEDVVLAKKLNFIDNRLSYFFKNYNDLSEFGKVFHAVADVDAKLCGCDIKKSIPKYNISECKGDPDKVEEYLRTVKTYILDTNASREEEMARKMCLFSEKRKTDAPIIAIIGKDHAEDTSKIYPALDEKNIKYHAILQNSDKEGNHKENVNHLLSLLMKNGNIRRS